MGDGDIFLKKSPKSNIYRSVIFLHQPCMEADSLYIIVVSLASKCFRRSYIPVSLQSTQLTGAGNAPQDALSNKALHLEDYIG